MSIYYKTLLEDLFASALSAADPALALAGYLPPKPPGRVVVIGAGKASARMAQAVENIWGPCQGLVIVPYGASLPTRGIEIIEASHPVPDEKGHAATQRILTMAQSLQEGDMALCLISGGGSALLCAPIDGISLSDKQQINQTLLRAGATIGEMNQVRKRLSAVKGGRLALAAYPAQIMTLLVSDVPGDDPAIIASGPTIPDMSSHDAALMIATRYCSNLPAHIRSALLNPQAVPPDVAHPAFNDRQTHIICKPQGALEAAAEKAAAAGIQPVILGDAIEGEAREVGKVMAGIARQIRYHNQPARPPALLISGGETTVTVGTNAGLGGRCSEFLLSFALASWDLEDIAAIACDTDGRDGLQENAGAIWHEALREKADRQYAIKCLENHDSYSFFSSVDGLVQTGPTHTNVNDFRAIYVGAGR